MMLVVNKGFLALTLMVFSFVKETAGQYTELEFAFMNSLNWCTEGESIRWVDKTAEAWAEKVRDGAKMEPDRDDEGKIQDLSAFVNDRMEVLPSPSRMDDLPTLIIESQCAYVQESTEDCWFDYSGSPIPQQWAIQDEIAYPPGAAQGPDFIRNWDPGYQFTVVYVPAQSTNEEATELTSNTERGLAELRLRGNSSRDNPKKQMRLRFREENAPSLIPGTAQARTWVLSAKLGVQPDRTYVGNPWAFETYRRLGELQKQHLSTWPEDGTIEDLATQAWSPSTHAVNLVYQGRFIGLFNILEQVEVLDNGGRVWVPTVQDGTEDSNSQPSEIDGITLPTGSYLLEMDLGSVGEFVLNEEAFQQLSYPEWAPTIFVNEVFGANLSSYSTPLWDIDYPDDVRFYQYSQEDEDPDVHNLRRVLEAIFTWAEDPIANNDKLAQVIDMKSMARYVLMEELTREGDAYLVSAKWKFVNGKLYNAALWDFGGGMLQDYCNPGSDWPIPRRYIDFENNTVEIYECNSTTGMPSNGWHVDRIYGLGCAFQTNGDCSSILPGTSVDNSTIWDLSHFFRHLFRAPSLQEEFWALWDLAVEHKLINSNEEDASDNDGDLFSAGALMDQMYNQVNNSAQVDLKIWNPMQVMLGILGAQALVNYTSVGGNCSGNLSETFLDTVSGNYAGGNPLTIPATDWSFTRAEAIGNEFAQFLTEVELPPELVVLLEFSGTSSFAEFFESAEIVAKQKRYIKARLEWIGQQRPQPSGVEEDDPATVATEQVDDPATGTTEQEDETSDSDAADGEEETTSGASNDFSPPFTFGAVSRITFGVFVVISFVM